MLRRAILSVINQTYKDIEIVVVDDNGANSVWQRQSSEVVSSFKDKTIKYVIHDKNMGGAYARNSGWKMSSGEYITFLDDDDEISKYKIERQVLCLEALDNMYGACYTGYHKILPKNKIVKGRECAEGDVRLKTLMRTLYVGSGSNLLLRKNVVDEVGGYDVTFKRNQDLEFMARVAEKYKFAYVSDDLLTIHYERKNVSLPNKQSVDDISKYYLQKFSKMITSLPEDAQKKVINVISLERARFLVSERNFKEAIKVLKNNSVGIVPFFKYLFYLFKRFISKTSYGFYY